MRLDAVETDLVAHDSTVLEKTGGMYGVLRTGRGRSLGSDSLCGFRVTFGFVIGRGSTAIMQARRNCYGSDPSISSTVGSHRGLNRSPVLANDLRTKWWRYFMDPTARAFRTFFRTFAKWDVDSGISSVGYVGVRWAGSR